jgi:hypothetical protein
MKIFRLAAAVVTSGTPAMAATPRNSHAEGISVDPDNQYQDGITATSDAIRAGGTAGAAAGLGRSSIVRPDDPTCGYLVTPIYVSGGAKVYTEAPKCGQKVRAVVNCMYTGGADRGYGNTRTKAGYSTAMCGSTAEVAQRGYQIYSGSAWRSITWYD